MWKVMIIVCTLGNPCAVFEEDPVKHYDNYDQCIQVASEKHTKITDTFNSYGYWLNTSEYSCTQLTNS
jgi:hypothetical protein